MIRIALISAILAQECPDPNAKTACEVLCLTDYSSCDQLCEDNDYACRSSCARDFHSCEEKCPCGKVGHKFAGSLNFSITLLKVQSVQTDARDVILNANVK